MTRRRLAAVRRAAQGLLTAFVLAAAPSWADRTNHLFLDETQLLPEGDVELEQWVWAEGRIPNQEYRYATGWVWFGPTVGISSHLELSLPLVLVATPEQTVLNSISLVARYRFFPREQDDGFQPLIRVEYQQPLTNYNAGEYNGVPYSYLNAPQLKVLLVATLGSLSGVRGTINIGVQMEFPKLQSSSPPKASFSALGTAGLGVSVPLGSEFRIAAELDGQLPFEGTTQYYVTGSDGKQYPYTQATLAQLFLGPSVAWTRGQIWVTFGSLFGLTRNSNRFLPKVLWGITF